MINVKDLISRLGFVFWAVPLSWIVVNLDINLVEKFANNSFFDSVGGLKPIYPVSILAVLLIIGAVIEYFSMLSKKFEKNLFLIILVWLIPSLLDSFLVSPLLNSKMSIYLLLIIVAGESFFMGKGSSRWKRASLLFSGTIFLYLAGSSTLNFFEEPFKALWSVPQSPLFSNLGFVFIITAIFMCDSFAYFVGSIWGKTKLTSISPKKSVEGAVGGLVGSIIVMTLAIFFFGSETTPLYLGVLLGIVIGVFAQVGDLTVSLMKRYFDVKDASNLIPGHGGILDRFDSVFFTLPIVQVIITLVIKLS
jgi:phosphatidate cytidylyltransferase